MELVWGILYDYCILYNKTWSCSWPRDYSCWRSFI